MSDSPKTILVVEDEQPIARALELKLSKAGFDIRLAPDGEQALNVLIEQPWDIDLILVDLIMPNMDGFDLLESIQKLELDIPVMVSSNLSQESDLEKTKELGAIDYFVKSNVSIADIVSRVVEFFANK